MDSYNVIIYIGFFSKDFFFGGGGGVVGVGVGNRDCL